MNSKINLKNSILTYTLSILVLFGQLGDVIWLPLWLDSLDSTECFANLKTDMIPDKGYGAYFILLTSSLIQLISSSLFYIIFGDGKKIIFNNLLILTGLMYTISAVFTPYVSSTSRNEPIIQAFLLNFFVPATVIIRFFWIKKVPSIKRLIYVFMVIVGITIASLPTFIPNLSGKPIESAKEDQPATSVFDRVVWIFLFILLNVTPDILMNICIEKLFSNYAIENPDDRRRRASNNLIVLVDSKLSIKKSPDIFFINYIVSLIHFGGAICLVWLEIIPKFGFSKSKEQFLSNFASAMLCTVNKYGNNKQIIGFAIGTLVSSIVINICSYSLIDKGEGSIFLAILGNMVTPLSFIFWLLFSVKSSNLCWYPEFDKTFWFHLVAIIIILPFIILYNISDEEYSARWTKTNRKIFNFYIWWFKFETTDS